MSPELKFSIELLFSTYKISDQRELIIPNYVLYYFLEITNSKESYEEEFINQYKGIGKEKFQSNLDSLRIEFDKMRTVLPSIINRFETESYYWLPLSDSLTGKFRVLYENYISQAKWSREKSLKVFRPKEVDYYQILEKLQVLSKNLVEIDVLDTVESELMFLNIYNPDNKIVKEKVADACWDELKKDSEIQVDQLIKIILEKYIFLTYQDESNRKSVKLKIKKSVRERYKYILNKFKN